MAVCFELGVWSYFFEDPKFGVVFDGVGANETFMRWNDGAIVQISSELNDTICSIFFSFSEDRVVTVFNVLWKNGTILMMWINTFKLR